MPPLRGSPSLGSVVSQRVTALGYRDAAAPRLREGRGVRRDHSFYRVGLTMTLHIFSGYGFIRVRFGCASGGTYIEGFAPAHATRSLLHSRDDRLSFLS